jgi:hypothetical protein
VLSCVGRGLCDGLITRPEESYRVSVCVWSRNPEKGGQRSTLDYKLLWIIIRRSLTIFRWDPRAFITLFVAHVDVRLCLWTAVTNWPLPGRYMSMDSRGGVMSTGEPKNSEKDLYQCHFVHHKSPFYLKLTLDCKQFACLWVSIFTGKETNKFLRVTITTNKKYRYWRKVSPNDYPDVEGTVILRSSMQTIRPRILTALLWQWLQYILHNKHSHKHSAIHVSLYYIILYYIGWRKTTAEWTNLRWKYYIILYNIMQLQYNYLIGSKVIPFSMRNGIFF